MSAHSNAAVNNRTLTVRIPLALRKRGGRKQVVTPDGAAWAPRRARVDNAMVKALARAFRWRKMLEAGVHGTIEELATAENINPSYVSRILRLTLLAPKIVEDILNGQHSEEIKLGVLMKPFPVKWEGQTSAFRLIT